MESIDIGVRLVLLMCAAGILYALYTWDDRGGRQLIVSLLGVSAAVALAIYLLPRERIVRSRWREPFFVVWSVLQILVITVAYGADRTTTSPLALLFFIPIVYAALSYSLLSMLTVAAFDFLCYIGAASFVFTRLGLDTTEQPRPEYSGFFAFSLAVIAILCTWYARQQDRRRGDLARISRADPLTGSLNRRGFGERFQAELNAAERAGQPLGLLQIDLDKFKEINDTQGHAAGDELLIWVVRTLQELLRPTDWVGRLGGDEFAVLLPGASRGNATEVADRVRYALLERAPASIGVAIFPIDGADPDELHRRADAELYEQKGDRPERALTPLERKELSWATTLANAVDTRMAVQHEHSTNVGEYAAAIGRQLGRDDDELTLLRMAGILHDVGKVVVPDRILRKAGPLTEEEFEAIKPFPAAGAELVSRIEGMEPIVPWIRHSHERLDGKGYPDGLVGDAVPLGARILHVADAYDSMTSKRTYRPAMSLHQALSELRAGAGTQFDPDCVAALEAYLASAHAA
ncbi:MAG TPA: diguanylate cyclase [Thermoleophilaceae bacterium]|nr:diguanylate cyclase [Thermoleophilaceae bacterium]